MWKPNWGYDTVGLHKVINLQAQAWQLSTFIAFQPSRLAQVNPTVSFNFPRPLQTRSFAIVGRCKKDINYLCNRRPNLICPPMKCLALMERGVSSTAHWIRDIFVSKETFVFIDITAASFFPYWVTPWQSPPPLLLVSSVQSTLNWLNLSLFIVWRRLLGKMLSEFPINLGVTHYR